MFNFQYLHRTSKSAKLPVGSFTDIIITRIKNIKNVTRCRDSRSAKSI